MQSIPCNYNYITINQAMILDFNLKIDFPAFRSYRKSLVYRDVLFIYSLLYIFV